MEGAAHHVPGEGGVLDRFLDDLPLYERIEQHFGGKVVLLNYGAAMHPPGARSYTFKPHRDVRAFTRDFPLSLNMLVMLDDFTVENGATLMLSGSHRVEAMPAPEVFQAGAEHAVGDAGDILLFDSLLVHSAAPNRSDAPRRALTLCFGRPFMKPQMDWVRRFGREAEAGLSPMARQLLGYHARVPETLDDFYQPPERWAFKADQR
jgi:ectoine hydroxylase-related dioxygenase (phytanoyl-CoA dioxygenase family)